uniref:Vacuolar protein sorting-associated protein VTA1 n=1 Tax=Ascaris suum TaxID=6253 RepID=F1KYH2_ASCSU
MASTQQLPQSLRPIAHYVKIANENAARDPIVYYWCLFYAVQTGMTLDKSSPGALQYLTSLLSTLESTKKQLAGQEALTQDMVAQAHVENFAMKLFEYADKNDRQSNFSKNVVKAFYTAGHLIDVLTLFGELDEALVATRKYAKWKATYIHNCLKNGETPIAGPPKADDESENFEVPMPPGRDAASASHPGDLEGASGPSSGTQPPILPGVQPEPPTAPTRSQPTLGDTSAAPTPAVRSNLTPSAEAGAAGSKSSSKQSKLTMNDYVEAQKYAKYAVSALQYEDASTAIENMHKALAILTKYE